MVHAIVVIDITINNSIIVIAIRNAQRDLYWNEKTHSIFFYVAVEILFIIYRFFKNQAADFFLIAYLNAFLID